MGSRAISCWPSCMTLNEFEVDQVSWNREKRCVCAIAGVLSILTLYEVRSRLLMMNLRYNIR